ncbi:MULTISPECIES: TatD family hydrolase [unclassified Wenzhouxiangella]|uniref:TatD family hydrolase n=1 Tax=unclassified Wenzhouxiangella TaxID=2613841 RepID=UPI000E32542D|nr:MULTISPECIES: TatD family hydrolase [unclassified Wenzhouxiangella]RFF27220.1 hydrolase TatD [Wenzhouxiangella sp. 15181]RFP69094.1 hydrolase TatD [Wenzhouxiangella sp. 15190]
MEWIDIGCNLTHDAFDSDRKTVIETAREAGVTRMIVTGATEAGSVQARELADDWPGVLHATAGVHPHHAEEVSSETLSVLAELHRADNVVAVGECGLDYFRDFSPRPAQRRAFEHQLELAVDCGKPVFLHQRDAHDDFVAIFREFRPHLAGAVVHCFTDTREALLEYLDMDCHIGITGWICDERRGYHLKEFVNEIPADRLMLETDAPYLKPRNMKPKIKTRRNEPQWLPWIAGTVAACRGVTPDQLAEETTATARRFFRLTD